MAAPRRPHHLTNLPWWSLLLMAVALINPVGLAFIDGTLHGDPLSQAIAGPILLTVLAGLGLLVTVEFGVRMMLNRRRTQRVSN